VVGVNVTAIVQLAPDATELPHVVTYEKSPLTVPVNNSGSPPVFDTRTSCAGADVATVCDPNVSVAGNTAIADAGKADTRTIVCPRAAAAIAPATTQAVGFRCVRCRAATIIAIVSIQSSIGAASGRIQLKKMSRSRSEPTTGSSEDAVVEQVSTDFTY